jgi:hypothetical protein
MESCSIQHIPAIRDRSAASADRCALSDNARRHDVHTLVA